MGGQQPTVLATIYLLQLTIPPDQLESNIILQTPKYLWSNDYIFMWRLEKNLDFA